MANAQYTQMQSDQQSEVKMKNQPNTHVSESHSQPGADKPGSRRTLEHFTGCLLGGAVGDAIGAPVEFHSIHAIRNEYGSAGITDYDVAYGRRGAITDDMQMALFTAEGLLRAITRQRHKGICHPASVIHHAYIRWLRTQDELSRSHFSQGEMDGWLIGVKGLHSRRAPGNTCLSALRGGGGGRGGGGEGGEGGGGAGGGGGRGRGLAGGQGGGGLSQQPAKKL